MLRRATSRSKTTSVAGSTFAQFPAPSLIHSTNATHSTNGNNNSVIAPSHTPQDEVIERIRLKIPNAHVFKLPPHPSSGGWRGADWRDKVWQGTLKVVERGEETAVLLVDSAEEKNIFAVCPIQHYLSGNNAGNGAGAPNSGNGVDRCVDSSRYFVLRIQNAQGRHMFIGLAFNERNDAFDFNTA